MLEWPQLPPREDRKEQRSAPLVHKSHLLLLLEDGLLGALLLVLEHAGPCGLLDHAQDLRRLHVENFRDAALYSRGKRRGGFGAPAWYICVCKY